MILFTFPKAGSHFIMQIIRAVVAKHPSARFSADPVFPDGDGTEWWGERKSLEEMTKACGAIRPGYFMQTHQWYNEDLADWLCYHNYRGIVLTRDLRDVVVSMAHFLPVYTEWFASLGFKDHEQVLEALLVGDEERGIPAMRRHWDRFAPWLKEEWIYPVTFEELRIDLVPTVQGIADWLPLPRNRTYEMMDASYPPNSKRHFRAGRVGDWRQEFTPKLVELAKQEFGGLGYEW